MIHYRSVFPPLGEFGDTSPCAAITEPEPGRVLVETNLGEAGGVTTFIVEPLSEGNRTEVTITTEGATRRSGALGAVERLLTRIFLQRIYKAELKQLARVCKGAVDLGAKIT